ncbi:MAG: Proprotein convertase [Thermoleophilia bacterium]|nr:Proprotein convertase [Thermoleophilia bacterium]
MLKIRRITALATAVLAVGASNAMATCNALSPTITGTSASETINGTAGVDVIEGGGGADTINGLGANDVICGNGGDDTISGGSGNDTLIGDTGYDTFLPGSGNDSTNGGSDGGLLDFRTVGAATTINLGGGTVGGDGSDTITSVNDVLGSNTHPDTIDGNSSANVLDGNGGDDDIDGAGGADDIDGGAGDDIIRPGLGDDTADGGANNDLISYSDVSAAVAVTLDSTSAQNTIGAGSDTLATFEDLTGTTEADTLTGSPDANAIRGGAGDDEIDGLAGADNLLGEADDDVIKSGLDDDSFDGGSDTDRIDFGLASDPIGVSLEAGTATGEGVDTITNIEDVRGSEYDDVIEGDDFTNAIDALGGNDIVDSREGTSEAVDGGDGLDTLSYASLSFSVSDTLGVSIPGGVSGSADDHSNFENVKGSAYNDRLGAPVAGGELYGEDGDDELYGGDGGDTLEGGAGQDELYPGDGTDTVLGGSDDDLVDYSDAGSAVTVSLEAESATGSSIGTDSLTSVEDVDGSAYGDDIVGSSSENVLKGGGGGDTISGRSGNDSVQGQGGVDVLSGGLGTDQIDGGADVDTVSYASASAGVTVDLGGDGEPQSTGSDGTDTISGVVHLVGSPYPDTLIGSDDDNVITAGSGADTITGGKGADELHGEDGRDTLRLDDADTDSATASTCGAGFDIASIDASDTVDPDCEYVRNVAPDTTAPRGSVQSVTEVSGGENQHARGSTIYINSTGAGSFTVNVAASDLGSGVRSVTFPDLGTGWSPSGVVDHVAPFATTYSFAVAPAVGTFPMTITDMAGNTSSVDLVVATDTAVATGGSLTYIDGTPSIAEVTIAFGSSTDTGAGVGSYRLERRVGALVGSNCDAYGEWDDVGAANQTSPYLDTDLGPDRCYQYRLLAKDLVGNEAVVATSERAARLNDCLFA